MRLTWLGTFANATIPSPASGPATGRPRPRHRTASALAVLALATIAATALPAATAEAQTATKLLGNVNQARASLGGSFANDTAQAVTTGSNAGGYKLVRVNIRPKDEFTSMQAKSTYGVRIHSDSSGSPGSSIATLTDPSALPTGDSEAARFTASGGGIDLAASTTSFVVVDASNVGTGTVAIQPTSNAAEDTRGRGFVLAPVGPWLTASMLDTRRTMVVRRYAEPAIAVDDVAEPSRSPGGATRGPHCGLRRRFKPLNMRRRTS